eukprot:CAMPEP_0184301444 /NCGR_PEP_ID=MMETSP1049-20130417/11644_1 /TAXON_ID=77928 /ORGANISM="Proteomonas sulcata, Strain CCMP704" /LENGTH=79 /DNA_ID=CAMNT_0026612451 /DNA_START=44 /DNA_END=279 /DNA_ORIENTATION=-
MVFLVLARTSLASSTELILLGLRPRPLASRPYFLDSSSGAEGAKLHLSGVDTHPFDPPRTLGPSGATSLEDKADARAAA